MFAHIKEIVAQLSMIQCAMVKMIIFVCALLFTFALTDALILPDKENEERKGPGVISGKDDEGDHGMIVEHIERRDVDDGRRGPGVIIESEEQEPGMTVPQQDQRRGELRLKCRVV